MKGLLLMTLVAIGYMGRAQNDTIGTIKNVKLEMLQTPSNAAFTVMGTTPAEIQQPSTAPEFVFALQNASNSFTQFPNNFGFSVTPFWWTHGKKLSFEEDFSTDNQVRLYRYLRVSGGVVNNPGNEQDLWRYGAGAQTSILVGKVDQERKALYLRKLLQLNRQMFERQSRYLQTFPEYNQFQGMIDSAVSAGDPVLTLALQQQRDSLEAKLVAGLRATDESDSLEILESFQLLDKRYGWKWDVGAALAYDLQNNNLDSSSLYRSGLWSNFGYSFKGNEKYQFSVVGAARYYYYDQVVYQLENAAVVINDLGVVDSGLRLILDAQKISISFEGLYRYGLSDAFESTYKLNAMLNYRFAENRMVYFSLGNDFNDTSVGDPNQLRVFVGINLGFGDKTDIEYRLR